MEPVNEKHLLKALKYLRDLRAWGVRRNIDPWAIRQALIMVLELKPGITLLAVLKMNLGKDLEVELGNPQRRIGRWFKPLEEDLEASG